MRTPIILMTVFMVVNVLSADAQTPREKIVKAMNDPNAEKNAGKADSMLINKKILFDSTHIQKQHTKAKNKGKCLFTRKKGSVSEN